MCPEIAFHMVGTSNLHRFLSHDHWMNHGILASYLIPGGIWWYINLIPRNWTIWLFNWINRYWPWMVLPSYHGYMSLVWVWICGFGIPKLRSRWRWTTFLFFLLLRTLGLADSEQGSRRSLFFSSHRNARHMFYPLVICYIAIEHGHRNSEFSHSNWWICP